MAFTAPVSNSIDTRTGAGVAGDLISRLTAKVDTVQFDQETNPPTKYAVALLMVAGLVRQFSAGDSPLNIKGALVRTEPAITELNGAPKLDAFHGRVLKGELLAVCAQGTPVRDQPVYIRVTEDGDKEVGDFETAAIDGETEAVPGWTFCLDGKDANGICGISVG